MVVEVSLGEVSGVAPRRAPSMKKPSRFGYQAPPGRMQKRSCIPIQTVVGSTSGSSTKSTLDATWAGTQRVAHSRLKNISAHLNFEAARKRSQIFHSYPQRFSRNEYNCRMLRRFARIRDSFALSCVRQLPVDGGNSCFLRLKCFLYCLPANTTVITDTGVLRNGNS